MWVTSYSHSHFWQVGGRESGWMVGWEVSQKLVVKTANNLVILFGLQARETTRLPTTHVSALSGESACTRVSWLSDNDFHNCIPLSISFLSLRFTKKLVGDNERKKRKKKSKIEHSKLTFVSSSKKTYECWKRAFSLVAWLLFLEKTHGPRASNCLIFLSLWPWSSQFFNS